ncbi:MAG: NTP transferase domain-containing protein [Oscillospiraceae bacterium]|nr:NTP transferase domain-containing protein [Oscillospiraceae bacterium]
MQTAAIIVAAGMSSRMGEFKPMLNIGSISIAQRIVANFHQAGVDRIVMITGFNATTLERHLSGNGIIFLRNENYETTQMFDSAKIGLEYLKDKCDRILFTPVDIPLFTSATVKTLVDSGAELACPVCQGQQGHPLLIASRLVDSILADSGEGGLQGAISRCGSPMQKIEVEDAGILHDADTPEDYRALLNMHNQQLVRPVVNVSLAKEMPFFDEKIATLLSLVDETNSVRTACQRMQISYSTGWNIIRTMESQFSRSLIERSQGGAGGGQSRLTEDGRALVEAFNKYSSELRRVANELFQSYFEDSL